MNRSFHTDLIPEAKQAEVTRVIQEVFGVDDVEDIRPVTGGLSSAVFMLLGTAAGAHVDPEVSPPNFDEFHDRLIERAIDMMTAEARLQYGRIHFERLRGTLFSPRFDLALESV
jgi:hypothetical protein